MIQEYDLFISYRRDKGSHLAVETERMFRQKYQIFYDRHEITAGDFTQVIREGLEGASVVFSLLSFSSLERMCHAFQDGKEAKDVVISELEYTKKLKKPVVFVYFQEAEEEQFTNPFDLLQEEKYRKYPLFQWISSLHINLYQPRMDFQKELAKVEKEILAQREKQEEQQQQRLRLTHKHKLSVSGQSVEYMGEYFMVEEDIIPLGNGHLYKNLSRSERHQFQGTWWGSNTFSGEGQLSVTRVLKPSEKMYQGVWHQLLYHDQDGWFQDGDTTYQGGFYHGKKQFHGMVETATQRCKGIYHQDHLLYGMVHHKQPQPFHPVYEEGNYAFYENGSILLRGHENKVQCFVQTQTEELRFSGEISEQEGQISLETIQEVAVRSLEEGEFQVILWGNFRFQENFTGNGTFHLEDEAVSFGFSGDFLDAYDKHGHFFFPDRSTLFVDTTEVMLQTGEIVPKNKENEGYFELILRCFLAEYQMLSCLLEKMPFLSSLLQYQSHQKQRIQQMKVTLSLQDIYYLRGRFPDYENCPLLEQLLKI